MQLNSVQLLKLMLQKNIAVGKYNVWLYERCDYEILSVLHTRRDSLKYGKNIYKVPLLYTMFC